MPGHRFLTALRLRIGAGLLQEPILCPRCDKQILDTVCSHALCCAPGESTRGHNRTRDSVLNLVHVADPCSGLEVPGLIPNAPMLRPADIYTEVALPGYHAALDIGICSPDATGAGNDCCESMYIRKMDTYAVHLESMASRNLRYKPLVLSCFGRPHPESHNTPELIAMQAARRHGTADHRAILRRAMTNITTEIWKRAASMVHSCMPNLDVETLAILDGS